MARLIASSSSSAAVCFVVLLIIAMAMAAAATVSPSAADKCEKDLDLLMGSCEGYLRFPAEAKAAPSRACCGAVRRVDVGCLCGMVTPEVEQYVCMDKAVYVAAYCHRPLLPGSYCGSKLV
ncbi:Os11g0484700 [Oryza sativa Japonica Group]|uniref:Os11g0484700 protein n=1 Tax=Oryza sativa subsp. japonica TaxID=39947 RepID=A0A0P0Y2N4_ORYSJ|nr:Os11g0484700 [Oryza sativa Japonica Group]